MDSETTTIQIDGNEPEISSDCETTVLERITECQYKVADCQIMLVEMLNLLAGVERNSIKK